MYQRRENTGRNTAFLCAAAMTLLFICLMIFNYMRYDRVRTLRASLEKVKGDPLIFSVGSGFFEESFVLQLNADEGIPREDNIEIRYTIDGDDPTQDSLLYTGGIDLEKAIGQIEAAGTAGTEAEAKSASDFYSRESQRRQWEEEKNAALSDKGVSVEQEEDGIHVIPVRARLVQGEDTSAVVTRTYVIGPGVFERYDAYVACISTDSCNLFDYEKGIMVRGSHYQEDIDEGVRGDRAGNFFQDGDEWIKDGHVTLFSPEGEVLLEEDTGITVGGYSSRGLPTRTLRVEASTARGSSDSRFGLDIFKSGSYSRAGNLQTVETGGSDTDSSAALNAVSGADTGIGGTTVEPDSFQKIRFRTHGVPQFHIRSVRNKYAKIISDASGFPGLSDARLGVIYLNGEFYTLCDVTPSVTKDYMSTLFRLGTPDAIEKYDSSDYDIYTRARILQLLNADLTQPENQKALEQAVDMDNYLFYFAIEVLFNNADWPFNNMTMWRYTGEQDPENPYTDGRYRFLLDDMDQILSNGLHGVPEQWSSELIDYLMRDEGNTFYHVMQCKKYRDTFLTYVDDLLQTTFAPEFACPILNALYADMEREYIRDYGEAFWAEMEDTAEKTMDNVREKEELYRENIGRYMGLKERYTVRIEADGGAAVTWNNMKVTAGEVWSNEYYRGTSFTVTAVPAEGRRFAGWEINGKADGAHTAETLAVSDALSVSGGAGSEASASGEGTDPAVQVTVRAITEPAR